MMSDFLRMAIAIFMTPFLLTRLGAAAYSILPLVNSCTSFLVLASGGIQGSVGRYFTLHLANNENYTANQYVNTAFFLMALVLGIAFVPLLAVSYLFPTFLQVPIGYEHKSQIVMLLMGANLYVDMLSNPFSIGFYSKQRFELRAIILCLKQLLHVLLVVSLFIFVASDILMVASSMIFTTSVASFFMIYFSKRMVPTLRCSPKFFDKSKLSDIGSYSFWILLSQVSWLIILNTDYIIINKFVGPAAVASYSLVARWNETIRATMMSAVAVITPLATELQAKDRNSQICTLLVRSVRLSIILLMAPSILLCVFGKELLLVWVGPDYLEASSLFWPVVLPLSWILLELPLRYILNGLGMVKYPALAGLGSAILNLILSLVLVATFNMGAMGVALASAISLTLLNLVFMPFYVSSTLKIKPITLLRQFFGPVIASSPMIALALLLKHFYSVTNWPSLIISVSACVVVYIISAYSFVLTLPEKQHVISACSSIILWAKKATLESH